MQIIPKNKLKYSANLTHRQLKRRKIRKTNTILSRMSNDALMASVTKSSRHIYISIYDKNHHKISTYSTLQYIEKDNEKSNKNYCNIEFANKIAKDAASQIKKLKEYKDKLVFNSGPYKYHGRIKTIDNVLKTELNK